MKKPKTKYVTILGLGISLILLALWFFGLLNPFTWMYPESNNCGDFKYTGGIDGFITCHAVGCPSQETPTSCPIDYLFDR